MHLLLVAHALRNQFYNYEPFFVALRGNSLQWWNYIEGTHIVVTQYDPTALTEKLTPYILNTDSLLIVPITYPMNGWLPEEGWNWLTKTLTALKQQKLLPH